ncbi:hypothetical protein [Vibrio cholerae]
MEQILFIMLPLEQFQTELNSLSTYDKQIPVEFHIHIFTASG